MFNFECLEILWAAIEQSSQKLWSFWICLVLLFSIWSVMIYYGPGSNIWVRSYGRFEFSWGFLVQFLASRYIMGLNYTYESKVIIVWIFQGIPCSILRVSINYDSQADIWIESYSHLNFLEDSLLNFERLNTCGSQVVIQLKSYARWNLSGVLVFNVGVSIYYRPELYIRAKRYECLYFLGDSMFNFKRDDILWFSSGHSSQKLWLFEFALGFLFDQNTCLLSLPNWYYLFLYGSGLTNKHTGSPSKIIKTEWTEYRTQGTCSFSKVLLSKQTLAKRN